MEVSSRLNISFHDEIPPQQSEWSKALLFLHGKGAHSGTWRKNIPYFAERGWRSVALTLPRSDSPEVTQTDITEYARITRDVLAGLRGMKLAAILGNSMGGWIAMAFCRSYPGLAERLVLEDAAGVNSDVASSVDLPTLIIWGKEDGMLPISHARILHSKIPSSILKTVDGAGHVPHWEKSKEFNGIVHDFLIGR